MSLRGYGWVTALCMVLGVGSAVAGLVVRGFVFTLIGLFFLVVASVSFVLSLFALNRHLKIMTKEGNVRFSAMLAEEEKKQEKMEGECEEGPGGASS